MSAIAHIRKSVLDVTQAELAVMTGVTQATVSRWEKGELWPDHRALTIIRDAGRTKAGDDWRDSWLFDTPPDDDAAPADRPRDPNLSPSGAAEHALVGARP